MIKKMTTRGMAPETKNFEERTAMDPCLLWCDKQCTAQALEEVDLYSGLKIGG
jgi:hypothetical protein